VRLALPGDPVALDRAGQAVGDMTALDAALQYHAEGLAIFPLRLGDKRGSVRWGQYRDAPMDKQEIREVFADPHNVAVLCGGASRNLVALDCDTPTAFAKTTALLAGLGIATWTVRRPPNGSKHDDGGCVLLRAPTPVKTTTLDGVNARGEGAYFVAPPSQHTRGGLYYNETPLVIYTLPTLTALPFLPLTAAPARGPDHSRHTPRLAWRLLAGDPATLAAYPSRSEAEAALCASLARAGFDFSGAVALLRSHRGPGKFKALDTENPRNALRYLSLTWHNAREFVATHDSEAGLLAARLREWALARPWRGRGASSDRAVYLAHLHVVTGCGQDPHDASARWLGELAGVSWQTAANANRRLVAAGLLELTRRATPLLSHVWRLPIPPDLEGDTKFGAYFDTLSLLHVTMCQSMHGLDAFRFRGLNKSACEVLTALQAAGEATVKDLAAVTGRHRTTVKRGLLKMLRVGVVVVLGDGLWCAVADPDFDEVARLLGTKGAAKRQRSQHIRDRRYNARGLERKRKRARDSDH